MGQALAFSDDPEETVYAPSTGPRLDATPLDRTPTGAASLESIPGLWRGDTLARVELESLPTGYDALDVQLPGGGWPLGALTEILNDRCGIGELRLFLPALAALSKQAGAPPVILLQPPHTPYAPAFAGAGIVPGQVLLLRTPKAEDALWACEQCLKYAPRCALFAWPRRLKAQDLRRLQLAVERRPVLAVLMREARATQQSSAAALRIALRPGTDARQLSLRILKRRGALVTRPVIVEPPSPLFFPPDRNEEPDHALDRPVPAATVA